MVAPVAATISNMVSLLEQLTLPLEGHIYSSLPQSEMRIRNSILYIYSLAPELCEFFLLLSKYSLTGTGLLEIPKEYHIDPLH